MKRILKNISIVASVALMATSCNLNEFPTFNDDDAFVAFDSTSVSVSEAKGSVLIPITLASVAGIETSIAYTATDGTAVAGVNYDLVDPTGVLNFDNETRTAYVELLIYNLEGEFTGDLSFTIDITNTGSVDAGASSTCTITITDEDHPLSFILGSYTVSAGSYFGGTATFTMTLTKDEKDTSMVYFENIAGVGLPAGYYGTVNADKTEIYVPLGQTHPTSSTSYGDGNIYFYGHTGGYIYDEGNMTIQISADGNTLTFPEDDYAPAISAGDAGYFEILIPGYTAIKQ